MVRIDAALLHADGSELWGSSGNHESTLLDCIGDCTLLLDKLDKAENPGISSSRAGPAAPWASDHHLREHACIAPKSSV